MRILIADDERMSRTMLRASLTNWGYDVLETTNGAEALEVLSQEGRPPIAIVDWMMPEIDGPTLCQEVRKLPIEPYVYILLLTAKDGQKAIVEAIEAGADDFVMKPFRAHELKARLRAGQRIVELQAQLFEAQERLRMLAMNDALTGLWNRRAILDALEREHIRCGRQNTPLGAIMVDVDHFKSINDTYGHPAGDEVLREVGRRLKNSLRPYDKIGRYGGEEFLMISPGCDQESVAMVAERIRAAIANEPIKLQTGTISVTASLGAVNHCPADIRPVTDLIQSADQALYRAKEKGRNRVEIGVIDFS